VKTLSCLLLLVAGYVLFLCPKSEVVVVEPQCGCKVKCECKKCLCAGCK